MQSIEIWFRPSHSRILYELRHFDRFSIGRALSDWYSQSCPKTFHLYSNLDNVFTQLHKTASAGESSLRFSIFWEPVLYSFSWKSYKRFSSFDRIFFGLIILVMNVIMMLFGKCKVQSSGHIWWGRNLPPTFSRSSKFFQKIVCTRNWPWPVRGFPDHWISQISFANSEI